MFSSIFEHDMSSGSISDEAYTAATVLLQQAQKLNAAIDPKRIAKLYLDDTLHDMAFAGPFGIDTALQTGDHEWLSVDWFERNRYAPSQLEQGKHTHQNGSMWRAAFEDLVCAQLGKEQHARSAWSNKTNNQALYTAWAQTPRDWMLGLQCRGILPPQLPSLYRHHSPHPSRILNALSERGAATTFPLSMHPAAYDFRRLAWAVAHFDEDETRHEKVEHVPTKMPSQPSLQDEQHLYEAFLDKSLPAQKPSSTAPCHDSPSVTEADRYSPQNAVDNNGSTHETFSNVTTNHITRADGSTSTRRVIERCYADGHTDRTETISETPPTSQIQSDTLGPDKTESARDVQHYERSGRNDKGWFWSR